MRCLIGVKYATERSGCGRVRQGEVRVWGEYATERARYVESTPQRSQGVRRVRHREVRVWGRVRHRWWIRVSGEYARESHSVGRERQGEVRVWGQYSRERSGCGERTFGRGQGVERVRLGEVRVWEEYATERSGCGESMP